MNSSAELRQLAHLLRVGAGAAREIAFSRADDAQEIFQLADQAVAMAERLDHIAARSAADEIGQAGTRR